MMNQNNNDFISLTDMAKFKNADDPRFVIQNWMKTRFTIDFLGIWEQMYNKKFNRVEFDTFKFEVGTNSFVMTPLPSILLKLMFLIWLFLVKRPKIGVIKTQKLLQ